MLSVSNISVQFGSKKLFNDVSFIVNPRDRIGLVGSNGTGKSTLLKIINKMIEPDSGEIAPSKHTTIGYLPQEGISFSLPLSLLRQDKRQGGEGSNEINGNRVRNLYDEVYSGLDDVSSIKNELDEIIKEMESIEDKNSDEYFDLLEQHGALQHRFEDLDGFRAKSSIEKILSGLGFAVKDFNKLTNEFSGGWQMRIALAKLLLKRPSVLLLDEPTNHLDLDSLLWLENYMKTYEGAIILVSHDRQFLDNITSKTIEISNKKVTIYTGNYSFYVKEKKQTKSCRKKDTSTSRNI